MSTVLESSTLRFGPRDAGVPMTLDEFDAAEFEEGHRYELIQRVLVVTQPPPEEERDSNEELGCWLRNYQDKHPKGRSLNLTLPEHNLRTKRQNRRPDRVIWTGLSRRPRTRGPVAKRDIPSIVVEFPSSRPADMRRDYDEKRLEYRDLGVGEYWIIDRFRRTLTVYSWRGKRWVKRTVKEGEVHTPPLLPGFELPLADLLAVSDKYAD